MHWNRQCCEPGGRDAVKQLVLSLWQDGAPGVDQTSGATSPGFKSIFYHPLLRSYLTSLCLRLLSFSKQEQNNLLFQV